MGTHFDKHLNFRMKSLRLGKFPRSLSEVLYDKYITMMMMMMMMMMMNLVMVISITTLLIDKFDKDSCHDEENQSDLCYSNDIDFIHSACEQMLKNELSQG